MSSLPAGKLTFILTDIEGSTNLLELLEDRYVDVVGAHRRLLREAFQAWGGTEIDTAGDGFFITFAEEGAAVKAAVAAQRAIAAYPWPEGAPVRVRIGMHTGQAVPAFGGYIGLDVHRAARIMAAGYGGEILLSQATQSSLEGALPENITLRDLGEHRLKDLSRAERIFQVVTPDLPSDFPPLRTLDVASNNLPIQLTSFIGRQREMTEVRRLLTTTRLLTLQGAGGAGKTRLAIQVAANLTEEFNHGVWLVDLAPLADPALVVQAVASTLGVREIAGRTLLDALLDGVRLKKLLLVLDNCEHLISACAQLAEPLLRSCPSLRILATSREPLAIPGEMTYRVPTLSIPLPQSASLEHLGEFEAVRLFVERAAFAVPDFILTRENAQMVAEICHRLDGMPLAIELAAARVRGMSVQQIAARLDDRFRLLTGGSRTALLKHQTLRAAMDWSYDLLSQDERALLRRLSVFAGGWTLEAAEVVCSGEKLERGDILDLLTHLVDRSLVMAEGQNSEVRYRLLETVRQYASQKLGESGETASVQDYHAQWYTALAEESESMVRGGAKQSEWLKRLEVEHGNMRVALEWSLSGSGNREWALRLSGSLWRFWNVRGYWNEGQEWLRRAPQEQTRASDSVRAKCLLGGGVLAFWQGDNAAAASLIEQALEVNRGLDDTSAVAECLGKLAQVHWQRQEYAIGRGHAEESLRLFRRMENHMGIANMLEILGFIALAEEKYAEARTSFEESLHIARELGDRRGIAWSLDGLGWALHSLGSHADKTAEGLLQEALMHFRELGDKVGISSVLFDLGLISLDPYRSILLLSAGENLLKTIGSFIPTHFIPVYEQRVAEFKRLVGHQNFATEWAKGRELSLEGAAAYALDES